MRSLKSPSELGSAFPSDTSAYSDGKTNKPLAIAVAVAEAAKHSGMARLIVISDFLVDADLSPSQQEFENDIESKSAVDTPLILVWKQNPRVQVKLMRFRLLKTSSVSQKDEAVRIQLLPFTLRKALRESWT